MLPLAGKVVTADALFTHRDICDTVTDAGGDTILAAKDNQETLALDMEVLFADGRTFPPCSGSGVTRRSSRPRPSGRGTGGSKGGRSGRPRR